MTNRLCNLTPSAKIQDDFPAIGIGFDRAQTELDAKVNANRIINGNFDIPQRGTSFTNPGTNTYTLDRFVSNFGADGGTFPTLIHSQQALTPGDISGSSFFYRINASGAGSGFGVNAGYRVSQRIEHATRQICGSGKKVTLSFYARSSISGKRLGLSYRQSYGSGGSPTGSELITGTIMTLTSNWTKYTATITTNTLAGKTFGSNNDDLLEISFNYLWGTTEGAARFGGSPTAESFVGSGNIDIAQVQLVPGDREIPIQPRSYAEELLLCLRYCRKIANGAKMASGQCYDSASGGAVLQFNEMRIAPTATFSSVSHFAIINQSGTATITTTALNPFTSKTGLEISFGVASGLVAGNAALLHGNSSAYILLDAEI